MYNNALLNREFPQSLIIKQRSLEHLSDKELIYLFKRGLAPRNRKYGSGLNGVYQLHHWNQNVQGPLMEIPGKLHTNNYSRIHPLRNRGGIGSNRPGWDQYRKDYWRARYIDELIKRGYQFPLELN